MSASLFPIQSDRRGASPPRLLVSDVDRTLLTHDYRLPDRVVSAIERARKAGVAVVLATARSPRALLPYAERLGVAELAICFNGGWTGNITTGAALESHPLPREAALRAMQEASDLGLAAMWFAGDAVHVLAGNAMVRQEAAITGEPLHVAECLDALPASPGKILCVADPDEASGHFAVLRQRLAGVVEAAGSHPRLLEIGPLGVSKRRAVETLAARLNVEAADCAAAGDAENDLGMLAWAGCAITVANGVAEAKRLASFVGRSCDEGGLADGVDWLLGERDVPPAPHPARI